MQQLDTVAAIAAACTHRRFVSAEFMYKPPPVDVRSRRVFEYALRSRLSALRSEDAVLLVCDSDETIQALAPLAAEFPHLEVLATVTNPVPYAGLSSPTPEQLGWEGEWQRCAMTDRWSRISLALEVARRIDGDGYLIMPAHDAVWGRDLLARLVAFSHEQARGGLPAAVSPYTYLQHSPVPGVEIPTLVIDVMNTALGRDFHFAERLARDEVQGFWGKMGMIPFAMCGAVMDGADTSTLEDDLELDRVMRTLGYSARALWLDDPALYRQAPSIFNLEGVRAAIERIMHYSLNVPATAVGGSTLNFPLDALGELKRQTDPAFAYHNEIAERLIAECADAIKARLDRYGLSWMDWGGYRCVVRLSDPAVEVWRRLTRDG
jgi:hypothetical protein